MINRLKRWIARVANERGEVVPSVVSHNSQFLTVYKIGNGYLLHKGENRPYQSEEAQKNVVYCANILDVCRQMINKEALQKLGIKDEVQADNPAMHTHGYVTGKLAGTVRPKPYNPNSDI